MSPSDELVGQVAEAKRQILLACYRSKLPREDLEDAFSQAVLEILIAARRRTFADGRHIAHALEQRFCSRVTDRRRALQGRSPIEHALATSVRLEAGRSIAQLALHDPRLDVESIVVARDELRRIGRAAREELTPDQREVLMHVVAGERPGELTRACGWGAEKYRKVAQRARARLRRRVFAEEVAPDAA